MAGQYLAGVVKNEEVGPDIYRLTIRAPEIAAHGQPGQFVMLRSGRGLDPLLSRPFSLHRTLADDGCFQVLFKVLGQGTGRLAGLPTGSPIGVVGPLGRGFDLTNLPATGGLGLVGGGLGMAPLLFLAQELRRRMPTLPLEILLGARNRRELEAVQAEFRLLGLEPGVATDDGSLGHHGLLPELLAAEWMRAPGAIKRVYCCGPWPMMAVVADQCRQHAWPCQVSLETMMACGFSACLGCAVNKASSAHDYWHVCKDGPVFDASEIVWR